MNEVGGGVFVVMFSLERSMRGALSSADSIARSNLEVSSLVFYPEGSRSPRSRGCCRTRFPIESSQPPQIQALILFLLNL